MRVPAIGLAWALSPWGPGACGGGEALGPEAVVDAAPELAQTFVHTFPEVQLESGEERNELCASWTLDNPGELFVNRVSMSAGPGWHHSNWFYVNDTKFAGEDGIWPCRERDLDVIAVAAGGGTLFAQSTQAQSEVQEFNEGVAIALPSRVRVVGQLHLLNAGDSALSTALELTVETIPKGDVHTILQPMAMQYQALDLPPRQKASFATDCDLAPHLDGNAIDFSLHYVLPHYHELGVGASIELLGGDRDGELVFSSDSPVGEAWGVTMDPPIALAGATGLRFRCDFDNPRDERVGQGVGDQEMCIILAFTDSELRWIGEVFEGREVSNDGLSSENQGDCTIFALPPWL